MDRTPHPYPHNARTHTPGPLHAQLVVSCGKSRGRGRLLFFLETTFSRDDDDPHPPTPPPALPTCILVSLGSL